MSSTSFNTICKFPSSPSCSFSAAASYFLSWNYRVNSEKGKGRHSVSLCLARRRRRRIHHTSRICISCSVSRVFRKRVFSANAIDTRTLENASTSKSTATIEIPVTCYQIIGVPDKAEKDEIVKSVMQLKSAEIDEGFMMDTVVSRQDLLMDVRDKLLFEPEYAGNLREKILPRSSLQIPWSWLPGALCLLQEVGEEKLVLDIGREALQHSNAKPHIHDILLSMALAECAIAKIGFEKNKVSHGFEALARAQCLLRSKVSLGKMTLLSQIEESLEDLAPACTLELLGMSHNPENAARRRGAIAALRELIRQGLNVETPCRVQDWPCFMGQALSRLMAAEIVDLLEWDELAVIRKNKKSIESQNQRVVIDFNCFYIVLMAHIALGFSNKQTELISKAVSICQCLMASEGIDLKFEEAFCLFLLGQGNEADAVEKLHQVESNSNVAARSLVSAKEMKDVSGIKPSLETWLKDSALSIFSDTRDFSPSLVEFFRGEKRTFGSKKAIETPRANSGISRRQVSSNAFKRIDYEESIPCINSPQHLGSAVKQLTPPDLQSSSILGINSTESTVSEPSVQLKRNLGAHQSRSWENWLTNKNATGGLIFLTVLGCILFTTFKLSSMNVTRKFAYSMPIIDTSSVARSTDYSLDCDLDCPSLGNGIADRIKKLLTIINIKFRNQHDPKKLHTSIFAGRSYSVASVPRKPMSVEEAKSLVKQWQVIKAKALGPTHQVDSLCEILDELMLTQWQDLADTAKARSCYWRFVLLQSSVLQADTWSDNSGVEMAEIEALLEEAAELVDESEQTKPNYYSTYKVQYILKRRDDGSWRFCEGDIQAL